jgi:hypothetical protein
MDTLIWDVTKAAPSHSTLAGVLATLAIAVLAVLSSSGGRPASDLESNGKGSRLHSFTHALAIRSSSHVFRILTLAMLLLLISAMVWGDLAGQPSIEAIMAAQDSVAKENLGDSTLASNVIYAVKVRESIIACGAVTLLAVGALSFVAGMLELMSTAATAESDGRRGTFNGRAFSFLAALAVYETTYFLMVATALLWNLKYSLLEDYASLAAMTVVLCICLPQRWFSRAKDFILVGLGHLTFSKDVRSLQVRLAVVSSFAAILAYETSPSGSLHHSPKPLSSWDTVGGISLLIAVISCGLFLVVTAWTISLNAAYIRRPEVSPSAEPTSASNATPIEIRPVSTSAQDV